MPLKIGRKQRPVAVILFVQYSGAEDKPGTDWNGDALRVSRQCPQCLKDSVVGHGRRSKQAHDDRHDWIFIRRGWCNFCGKTITFLPSFSLPYTHYSLIARSQALQRYFGECCSLDLAAPTVKDPNRTPDASTLRRWFRKLDSAQRLDCLHKLQPDLPDLPESAALTRPDKPSSFPFLRQMIAATADRIASGKILRYGAGRQRALSTRRHASTRCCLGE
jgi:hypothetical protein